MERKNTPLGHHLCMLPLDPNTGKMLLMGSIFHCLDPVLTIASALAHNGPFVFPINRKEGADAAKRYFAGYSCSDHISLLKAFEAWKDAKCSGRGRAFFWENFLSPITLQMMNDMQNQFLDLLSGTGLVNKAKGAKRLRGELDKLLQRKIEEPSLHIPAEGKDIVAAAIEFCYFLPLTDRLHAVILAKIVRSYCLC